MIEGMQAGDEALFNRVEIDLAALKRNYKRVARRVGQATRIMAVVKSDAYGHGLVSCARALAYEGAVVFGVAEIAEGISLREKGIKGEIIVLLGVSPAGIDLLLQYNLSPVIYDSFQLELIAARARETGALVDVHLKVDCGMGRLGIMPGEVEGFARSIAETAGVRLAGIISHFPMADSSAEESRDNLACFVEVLERLPGDEEGPVAHMANSAAIIRLPEARFDMVRPGISLYGCYPVEGGDRDLLPGLEPVMSFKSRVAQVKKIPAGRGISYGHTHVTRRETMIAVLPVGYDDGYGRGLSNRGQVLIHGRRALILGRVCMNACMVDITDIPQVVAGDEVVLLGRQGEEVISADEIAAWLGTISYEVLCNIGGKNRRFYSD